MGSSSEPLTAVRQFALPEKVDEGLVEVVAVLDMSGSMKALTNDTIGGFNQYLSELKKSELHVNITLIVFNKRSSIVFEHQPIAQVQNLSTRQYSPSGGTALIDALGTAIDNTKEHICAKGVRPGRVSFFVTTDGQENASQRYRQENVKQMVTQCTEDLKWEFIFAGANINAVQAGSSLGFKEDNIANIHNDARGQEAFFKTVASAHGSKGKRTKSIQETYDENAK